MGKRILAIWQDLSNQDNLVSGQIVHSFEGKLKIIDPTYQNENGQFILCEPLNSQHSAESPLDQKGAPIRGSNPYEVIGTLHMPGLRHFPTVPGFFIKEIGSGKVMGYSFSEAFELLFEQGATNAKGILKEGRYQSIECIAGLPPFRSYYWKIQTYNENGESYAELTAAAKEAIDRMMARRRELKSGRNNND